MVAWPTAFDATGKSALVAPDRMLTTSGTEATPGALETSVTAVMALGARETVTVSVPGVPVASGSAAGVTLVTTGGGGLTSTTATALEPFTDAVTFAVPAATAATRIGAETEPAVIVTASGTPATPGAS